MKIPVILADLVFVQPDGTVTPVATFRTDAAARRILLALKSEQGAGTLELAAGGDVGVLPRPDVVEADDLAAARSAGYVVNEGTLREIWARVYAAPPAVQEALGLSPEQVDAEPADVAEATREEATRP